MAASSSVRRCHRLQLLFALCIFIVGSFTASQSRTSDSPQQASPHDRPATHSVDQLGTPPGVEGAHDRVHPEVRSPSSNQPVGTVQKLLMKTSINSPQQGHPHLSQSPHEPKSSLGATKLLGMHKNQLPVGVFNTLDLAASMTGPAPPCEDPLDISTSSGRYLGFTNQSIHQVDTWLGIRYAEPPIGDLRFRAPILLEKPHNGSEDHQPAFQFKNACPQEPFDNRLDVKVSEDCLYLNVYRPSNSQATSPMPVLVWIHGGALTYGTAAEVDGAGVQTFPPFIDQHEQLRYMYFFGLLFNNCTRIR